MDNVWHLLYLVIGFVFGYLLNKQKTEEIAERVRKQIQKTPKPTIQPGVIHRPTVQQLKERAMTEKQREGLEAVRETLRNVPELNT